MTGVDYSWARPGGAAIKAAGCDFVMRYVPYPGDGGKGLTADEAAELRANGLAIGLVFERDEGRPLGDFEAGVEDGHLARAAVERLGYPGAVYFAVDFDLQVEQNAAVIGYFNGVNSVTSPVGVYGGTRALELCQRHGLAKYLWQALGWNRGDIPGRHLYQYAGGEINGGAVDFNEAYAEDFGQWTAKEEDMAELEDLILACFSGQEEGDLSREERLVKARYRMAAVVDGAQEPGQLDRSLAQRIENASGGGNVPEHHHIPGGVQ